MVIDREKYMDAKEVRQLRTVAEAKAIVDLKKGRITGPLMWMLVDLALSTGLRVSEMADLKIERIGSEGGPQPITPEQIDEGLAAAANYVVGTANLFTDWSEGFREYKNELRLLDPEIAKAAHGDPNICYFHGYWEIADDEALRRVF